MGVKCQESRHHAPIEFKGHTPLFLGLAMGGLSKKSGNKRSCCHRTLTVRQCGIVLFHYVAITFLTNKLFVNFSLSESFFLSLEEHQSLVNGEYDQ